MQLTPRPAGQNRGFSGVGGKYPGFSAKNPFISPGMTGKIARFRGIPRGP